MWPVDWVLQVWRNKQEVEEQVSVGRVLHMYVSSRGTSCVMDHTTRG